MRTLLVLFLLAAVTASGCTSTDSSAQNDLKKGEKALSEAMESDTYTVKYTESGFTPKRLVIREEDKVRWISRNGEGVELVFPQSENCGNGTEMNTCGKIQKYSYKFEKAGKYNFYSDSNRVHRGMIVVQERGMK